MTYYRVKLSEDGEPRYKRDRNNNIFIDGTFVGHELYTEKEYDELFHTMKCFEIVHVPYNKICWFYGRRFEMV